MEVSVKTKNDLERQPAEVEGKLSLSQSVCEGTIDDLSDFMAVEKSLKRKLDTR